ncbi:hypothetical protein FQZ97_997140 [compost metagenome]
MHDAHIYAANLRKITNDGDVIGRHWSVSDASRLQIQGDNAVEFAFDGVGGALRDLRWLVFQGVVQVVFGRQQRTLRGLPHFHFRAGDEGAHQVGWRVVADENCRGGFYGQADVKQVGQLHDACTSCQYDDIGFNDARGGFNAPHGGTLGFKAENRRLSEHLRAIRLSTGDQRMGCCYRVQCSFIGCIRSLLRRALEVWLKFTDL